MGVLLPIVRSVSCSVVVRQAGASWSFGVYIPVRDVLFNGSFVVFSGVRVVSRRG